jgi:DNA-binding beta-propeller fold protein YncE
MWRLAAIALALSGCAGEPDPCAETVPGAVCFIAGTGDRAFNGDGRAATATSFYFPSQARRGPDGLLYVMDMNNQRLRRIEADGTVSTIAGQGDHLGATLGVPATESPLENPIDFDFLPDGRIVFVSYHDPRVIVLDSDGTLQLIAGSGEPPIPGFEGDGGPAVDARFRELSGIAIDPAGRIFVADSGARRIRMIENGVISTLAGTGLEGYAGDGGPATLADLNAPSAVALDAAGNLYVSDTGNCAIRRVALDGTIQTIAGIGEFGYAGDGGAATTAQFAHQEGLAVAPDGTLYVADRFNFRIRKIAPDGTITTLMGSGANGPTDNGAMADEVKIGHVSRIQFDGDRGLLISDQTNSRVLELLGPF